jgi:hypothetical protein
MGLEEILRRIHLEFDGFNPPALHHSLAELQRAVDLPPEVVEIYHDHDGSNGLPRRGDRWLPARLMPIAEVLKIREATAWLNDEMPSVGSFVFLWTDDNSNYAAVYTSGLLAGWITVFDHEEPALTPAYRSARSFLTNQMLYGPGAVQKSEAAYDLRMMLREVPVVRDDPLFVNHDRELVTEFRTLHQREGNDDVRRLYAKCAICLTPVQDTNDVLSFLNDQDMWTPESAIRLLELREFEGGVDELARLAREGYPNGDSAAMRLLVRMDTDSSRRSVADLSRDLTGQKRKVLQQWLRLRDQLQPPRW